MTLKVKYADFKLITRSKTNAASIATQSELKRLSLTLLGFVFPVEKGVRLLGVSLSSMDERQYAAAEQFDFGI